eukprot:g48912.t1
MGALGFRLSFSKHREPGVDQIVLVWLHPRKLRDLVSSTKDFLVRCTVTAAVVVLLAFDSLLLIGELVALRVSNDFFGERHAWGLPPCFVHMLRFAKGGDNQSVQVRSFLLRRLLASLVLGRRSEITVFPGLGDSSQMKSFWVLLLAFALQISSVSAGTDAAGLKYLEENKKKEGVVVLPSGLQYKVLKSGPPGGKTPLIGTPCDCHYKGELITGTEFDSSYKRGQPLTFAPNQVIKGWTEAMQLMKEGDKWQLVIPPELGYGERGAGGVIPGNAVLVFEMELLKVKGAAKELL